MRGRGIATIFPIGIVSLLIFAPLLGLSATETNKNPPAMPECQPNPEIANIIQSDGKIAPVNIIRVKSTVLYVPKEWAGLVDVSMPDASPELYKGHMTPDYRSDECPGVIYEFTAQGSVVTFGFDFGDFLRGRVAKNIDPNSSIHGLAFERRMSANYPQQAVVDWPTPYSVLSAYNDDLVTLVRVGRTYPSPKQIAETEEAVRSLLDWVTTPPARRNNDQIFTMGTR